METFVSETVFTHILQRNCGVISRKLDSKTKRPIFCVALLLDIDQLTCDFLHFVLQILTCPSGPFAGNKQIRDYRGNCGCFWKVRALIPHSTDLSESFTRLQLLQQGQSAIQAEFFAELLLIGLSDMLANVCQTENWSKRKLSRSDGNSLSSAIYYRPYSCSLPITRDKYSILSC